jgi:hypothetical protein
MNALTLAPKHWFSWQFVASDDHRRLIDFRISNWREKGVISVDGVDYRVYRESAFGDFVMEHAGSIPVRASKPSIFHREFLIRYQDRTYTLRARSWFSRAYVLREGSTEVGSLVPQNWGTYRSTVILPDGWPLYVKAFAMWLTIIHWKRSASSS